MILFIKSITIFENINKTLLKIYNLAKIKIYININIKKKFVLNQIFLIFNFNFFKNYFKNNTLINSFINNYFFKITFKIIIIIIIIKLDIIYF